MTKKSHAVKHQTLSNLPKNPHIFFLINYVQFGVIFILVTKAHATRLISANMENVVMKISEMWRTLKYTYIYKHTHIYTCDEVVYIHIYFHFSTVLIS